MSTGKCARCDKIVYPVETLRCLDKLWHKGCFKCHECNMTLSMKNYKGFEKRPYCNAHCPQAKATTVADTPEIRRLAENTRIQSQAKYHEDFEKSKGKGFTTILDDPEMRRVKGTSKIISNVAYHGELERKKQMEERRTIGGHEDSLTMSNNNVKHQNNLPSISSQSSATEHTSPSHQAQFQQQQMLLQQQQQQQHHHQQHQLHHQLQQQQYMQKQQALLKQQEQYNAQNRQPAEVHHQQQMSANQSLHQQSQYQISNHPQQQQIMMRNQQQQQQIIMQQHRQSMDPSIPINRQTPKRAIFPNNHQLAAGKNPNMVQARNQQPVKYLPVHDPMTGQFIPPHLVGMPQHMINQSMAQVQQQSNRRVINPQQQMGIGPQHHNNLNYGPSPLSSVDGIVPKQGVNSMVNMPLSHQIARHPDQVQQLQMRPASFAGQPLHQPSQNQVPRRVFRAMYDYVANDVDEVSFFENDILVDCVNVDRNWLVGKVARSGQTGMLPANYVAELPSQ